jgi:NADH-quinone oxidoreductase subunit L
MLIGTLAISGIPPFSGFFSKDEILSHAFAQSPALYILGVIGAMLTAFYMFRMLYLTFYGKFRGTHEQEHHLHESPSTMTIPLIVLAVLSAIGGLLGIPESLGGHHWLQHWLEPVFSASNAVAHTAEIPQGTEMLLMCVSVGAAVLAIIYAYIKYNKNATVPVSDQEERSFLANLSYHKFYVDEIYDTLIRKPLDILSGFFYHVIERMGIDGLVNGIGDAPIEASKGLRLLQTGNVGFYIFMMVICIIAILVYSFIKI